MIDLVVEKASEFRRSIEAIAALINEAEFIIDESALTLKATDPSQISMIDFRMPKAAFKEYRVNDKTKIGLDLAMLKDIMSRCKASDSLEISVPKDKPSLLVTFIGSSKRSFSIPLLDLSSSELPVPKIDFDAEVKLKAEVLQDALKDSSLIASHITLGIDADKFYVKASSTKGVLNSETSRKDKSLLELKAKKECKAMFPLDYLQNMLKGAASDSEISVFLKADAPLKLSYKISSAELTYFLAPRIESG